MKTLITNIYKIRRIVTERPHIPKWSQHNPQSPPSATLNIIPFARQISGQCDRTSSGQFSHNGRRFRQVFWGIIPRPLFPSLGR